MTHWQDATGSLDVAVADNHSTIVEGGVLEEDVFDELLTDTGIDAFTRVDHIVQRHIALDDDEGSHLAFTHIQTRHDDRHDDFLKTLAVLLLVPA